MDCIEGCLASLDVEANRVDSRFGALQRAENARLVSHVGTQRRNRALPEQFWKSCVLRVTHGDAHVLPLAREPPDDVTAKETRAPEDGYAGAARIVRHLGTLIRCGQTQGVAV